VVGAPHLTYELEAGRVSAGTETAPPEPGEATAAPPPAGGGQR